MREIEEYIKDPDFYLTDVEYNHGPHMFLYNPQLLFFGVPSYLLKNVSRDQEKVIISAFMNHKTTK